MISFKGAHFPQDIILTCVRWYIAYPLSYRHVEELMAERGVSVDHATINRWVLKYSPKLEEGFHYRKRPVGKSWRMDETYIRVKGEWCYLYRAVDKHGQTIDFLRTKHRDQEAADPEPGLPEEVPPGDFAKDFRIHYCLVSASSRLRSAFATSVQAA